MIFMGKISKAELSSGLKAEIESKAKQVDLETHKKPYASWVAMSISE